MNRRPLWPWEAVKRFRQEDWDDAALLKKDIERLRGTDWSKFPLLATTVSSTTARSLTVTSDSTWTAR